MFKILEVVGHQDDFQEDYFESKKMSKFYKFAKSYTEKQEARTLKDIHPGVESEFIEMIDMCLKLNPDDRMTAEQCLKHKMFDDIRGEHENMIEGDYIPVKIDQLKTTEKTGELADYGVAKMQRYIVSYTQKVQKVSNLRQI